MKAENPQLNISEVSFSRGKGGKKSSSGISNVSNFAVDDRLFEKHEYHALTPEQKNTLYLNQLKCGHVGNGHGGGGNGNGKCNGKVPTLKSLNLSITVLATKFGKLNVPNYDTDYESPEEEEGTSNHSNTALTRQSKKKKRGGN
jgi:hypothetical protein